MIVFKSNDHGVLSYDALVITSLYSFVKIFLNFMYITKYLISLYMYLLISIYNLRIYGIQSSEYVLGIVYIRSVIYTVSVDIFVLLNFGASKALRKMFENMYCVKMSTFTVISILMQRLCDI